MRSGALDRLIYIKRRDTGKPAIDKSGVPVESFQVAVPMRAELLDKTASDTSHESGHITDTVLNFRLRFLANVNPGDLVHYAGKEYEILNVKENGRAKGLEFQIIQRGSL